MTVEDLRLCVQVPAGGSGGPGLQPEEAELQVVCSQRTAYRRFPEAFKGLCCSSSRVSLVGTRAGSKSTVSSPLSAKAWSTALPASLLLPHPVRVLPAGVESDQIDLWIWPRALWKGEGRRHHQDGSAVWSGNHCSKLTHALQPRQVNALRPPSDGCRGLQTFQCPPVDLSALLSWLLLFVLTLISTKASVWTDVRGGEDWLFCIMTGGGRGGLLTAGGLNQVFMDVPTLLGPGPVDQSEPRLPVNPLESFSGGGI